MVNHHSYHQESLESAQHNDQINNNDNTDQFPNHFSQEILQEHFNNVLSNHEEMNNLCYNQNMQHQDIPPLPPPTPDLQNMFPNFLPTSSLSFPCPPPAQKPSNTLLASLGLPGDFLTGPSPMPGSVVYDPLLPLNLPPQPPLMLTDLIQSLPNGYNFGVISNDNREDVCGAISQDVEENNYYENGVFEFKADVKCSNGNGNGKGRKGKRGKMPFVNEKQRRVQVKGKYTELRRLVPNPTKDDRASIVLDAIEYINELRRTVAELKIVVEKKRFIKDNLKRQKLEDGMIFEGEDGCVDQKQSMDGSSSSLSLRSSWLHRKSKSSEVDVHIIDDEVTVKIVQQKRMNCLMFVSKVLDELLLDIHHAAGGLIGDSYSYIFNCKICEGSMVYASGIANKLIEAMS